MELKDKTCEEILRRSLETFDAVDNQEGGITDWRSIFEAAFQCLLTLKSTEAMQLFATMCLMTLDFETYSELEDVLLSHSKELAMSNTITYLELNKETE